MKVSTPLGTYPFEYRRIQRRAEGIAIVGRVAGLESGVVLGREDLRVAAGLFVPALALVGALVLRRRARCG